MVALPRLLGGEIHLIGYPLPMILAEKIVTAVQRGTANTRWRDFAHIYALAHQHMIAGDDLRSALVAVAEHRYVSLAPLEQVLDGYAFIAQRRWTAWRRRIQLHDQLPEQFAEVLETVTAFADPVLGGEIREARWSPTTRRWN